MFCSIINSGTHTRGFAYSAEFAVIGSVYFQVKTDGITMQIDETDNGDGQQWRNVNRMGHGHRQKVSVFQGPASLLRSQGNGNEKSDAKLGGHGPIGDYPRPNYNNAFSFCYAGNRPCSLSSWRTFHQALWFSSLAYAYATTDYSKENDLLTKKFQSSSLCLHHLYAVLSFSTYLMNFNLFNLII